MSNKKPFAQTAAMKQQIEADQKAVEFFKQPKHREEAKEIVRIWYNGQEKIQDQVIDYCISKTKDFKEIQILLNMLIFLNHYTQEIKEGATIHSPNNLELCLINISNEVFTEEKAKEERTNENE